MKEKIIALLVTHWKKIAICVGILVACIVLYSAGCIKGCNLAKCSVETGEIG
jgi:hypothetical protein